MISANATYRRLRATATHGTLALQLRERSEMVQQALLIPGYNPPNPNNLFRDGQVGGWLDPYDLTKMWVDSAGTTPMTASDLGVGIGRIQSKGGPVITFEQATSGDRLVWGRHPVSGIRNLLSHTEAINAGNGWTINGTGVETDYPDEGRGLNVSRSVAGPGFGISAVRTVSLTGATAGIVHTYQIRVRRVSGPTTVTIRGIESGGATADEGSDSGSFTLTSEFQTITFSRAVVRNDRTGTRFFIQSTGSGDYVIDTVRPQQETGSTATTYQKVTNRFDITETGQPDLYYFSGNGVNQSWSSNATVDFGGTDKVTVWAGVRKLSDAARGILCEFGNLGTPTSGSFAIDAPAFPPGSLYHWQSSGSSVAATSSGDAAYAAPHTASLVCIGEISSDTCQLQINGETVSSATDQGSGNYGNHTLHIGRRGGSSLPFNGYIYSLIIAGDNYDTRTIKQFSDWSLKPRRLIVA